MNEPRRSTERMTPWRASASRGSLKPLLAAGALAVLLAVVFLLSPYGKNLVKSGQDLLPSALSGKWTPGQAPRGGMGMQGMQAGGGPMPGMSMAGGEMSSMPMEGVEMAGPTTRERVGRAPISLKDTQRRLLGVQTAQVEVQPLEKVIRTVGRVEYDERKVAAHSLKVGGWIGELYVHYAGQPVEKGQRLFTVYSPELLTAQEEYLLALETRDRVAQSPLADAAREVARLVTAAETRLRLWDLTDAQIRNLAETGRPQVYVPIYSPVAGYVIENHAWEGMFIKPGMTIFKVADLSRVWALADIYEYEMPFVNVGQEAMFSLAYLPGERFTGKLAYIYPTLDTETRTVRVRLEFPNPDLTLKPGMYGNVAIKVSLGKRLAVPENAVLRTGERDLVFVDNGNGMFEPREIELGPKVDRHYVVRNGLKPGERVAASATFLLDSESQLMAATGGMKGMMSMIGMGDAPMIGATMGMAGMEGMEEMSGMKGMQGMEGMEMEKPGVTSR